MNPTKEKKATNVRSAGADEHIKLMPKVAFSLEEAISMARDDELVEITPKSIRIRKVILDKDERRRMRRKQKSMQ